MIKSEKAFKRYKEGFIESVNGSVYLSTVKKSQWGITENEKEVVVSTTLSPLLEDIEWCKFYGKHTFESFEISRFIETKGRGKTLNVSLDYIASLQEYLFHFINKGKQTIAWCKKCSINDLVQLLSKCWEPSILDNLSSVLNHSAMKSKSEIKMNEFVFMLSDTWGVETLFVFFHPDNSKELISKLMDSCKFSDFFWNFIEPWGKE